MTGRKVLMVEGGDDEHVLKHICGKWEVGPLNEIRPVGDCDRLLAQIPVQAKLLNRKGDVMGVVIDADVDLENRWKAVRNRFMEAGYLNVPDDPHLDGTILTPPAKSHLPKAGVWIMPDNRVPGILENFLLFLVPPSDQQLPHAKSCVESITQPLFKDKDMPKALIHTWLAWQKTPGKPYGTAITARFLDSTAPAGQVLGRWLRRLFG